MKCLYLEWLDSASDVGWFKPEDAEKIQPGAVDDLLMYSVGFKLYEDKVRLIISTTLSPSGAATDPMSIPKRAILKRRTVRLPAR